jgi:hypothetical protein
MLRNALRPDLERRAGWVLVKAVGSVDPTNSVRSTQLMKP